MASWPRASCPPIHQKREATPDSASRVGLSTEDWSRLYVLAHTDKARAYQEYARHYFQTDGQAYWSDDQQFSPYLPEAGDMLYRRMGWKTYASLMITELYIPRTRFVNFMTAARRQVLATQAKPGIRYRPANRGRARDPATLGRAGLRVRNLQPVGRAFT